jgi:hypothetical protein
VTESSGCGKDTPLKNLPFEALTFCVYAFIPGLFLRPISIAAESESGWLYAAEKTDIPINMGIKRKCFRIIFLSVIISDVKKDQKLN